MILARNYGEEKFNPRFFSAKIPANFPFQISEKFAQNWEKIADDFSATRKNFWSEFEIFSRETLRENFKILDAGCGNGRAFPFFVRKNCQVFGIDRSKNLVKIAREKFPDSKIFCEKMEENWDFFEPEFFDAIWSIASFHCLEKNFAREKFLQNAHRVLKKNGKIAISVWNLNQKKFRKFRRFFRPREFEIPFGDAKIPRFYFQFCEKSLRGILEKNFFEIEKIFHSPQKRNLCAIARKVSRRKICGVNFDIFSRKTAVEKFEKIARGDSANFLATPNPEFCVAASTDLKFKKLLRQTKINFTDGIGILWAEKFRGKNFFAAIFSLVKFFFARKNRGVWQTATGVFLFQNFCENSADEKTPVFLLGGAGDSAECAARKLRAKNSKLRIVGTDAGSAEIFDEKRICEKVKKSGARVLFVAFGARRQEFWIARNLPKLPEVRLAIGVGGAFDFIAGKIARAPRIFQKLGIEFFWRLLRQPQRFFRIYRATIKFANLLRLQ